MNPYDDDVYLPEDFEIINVPHDIMIDELPEFMQDIADGTLLSKKGLKDFFERFGMHYLRSEFVKRHTDGWSFLFLKREYRGAFKNKGDAIEYGDAHGGGIFIFNMHPRVIQERREITTSVSSMKTSYAVSKGVNVPYYTHSYYTVNVSMAFILKTEQ
jgi:hypothetical protein